MKLVSWNIAHRRKPWHQLLEMEADVALLQEAAAPPPEVAAKIKVDSEPWQTFGTGTARSWRAAIVQLSNQVNVSWYKPVQLEQAVDGNFAVSRRGTLSAAVIENSSGDKYIVFSMYGLWEVPHRSITSSAIFADATVHRLISDISAFVVTKRKHQIIAAGDLNILHGYGERGNQYWASRYRTVFQRMNSVGLPFIGPQAPYGRTAVPWPSELPAASQNVPTYHAARATPLEAERQLDFVFASSHLVDKIHVQALNSPEEWGASDHCRVLIDVQ